jgi:predicted transcriptional regulator
MDPQEYTPADHYDEYVETELPDLSEVSAAALAFIRAIQKFEQSRLVTGIEPVTKLADLLAELITESVDLDEDERYPHHVRSEFGDRVDAERCSWLRALDQDLVNAMIANQPINLAGMVVDILGAKRHEQV